MTLGNNKEYLPLGLALTWLQFHITAEVMRNGGLYIVANSPHHSPIRWLISGRAKLCLNLTRATLDLSPETPSQDRRGSNRLFATKGSLCQELRTPTRGYGELDHKIFDWSKTKIVLLAYAKRGSNPNRVSLLTVLHEHTHSDRGADVGIYRCSQQLKWIAINGLKLDLSCVFVDGLIHTWMENHIVQPHLPRHAH